MDDGFGTRPSSIGGTHLLRRARPWSLPFWRIIGRSNQTRTSGARRSVSEHPSATAGLREWGKHYPSQNGRTNNGSRLSRWLRNQQPFDALSATVGIGFALLVFYALFGVVSRLFWDRGFTLAPIREAVGLPDLATVLSHTLFAVGASALFALMLGSLLAWLNERTDARMGAYTDALPVMPLLMPSIGMAIGWVLLLSPRSGYLNWAIRESAGAVGIGIEEGPFDIASWYGLIIVYTIQMVPLAFLAVSAGLRNMNSSLEEQARVCGASPWGAFSTVTLRAVLPSLGAAVFLLVWYGFANFSVPAIIAQPANIQILSVRIARLVNFEFPARIDLAVGLGGILIPILGTIYYLQRWLVGRGRHSAIGGKSAKTNRVKLGKLRPLARSFFVLYGVVTVILPFAALLLVSLNGFWSTNITWSELSLESFRSLLAERATRDAMRNSVLLASTVGILGVFIAATVSLWVSRTRNLASGTVDLAMKIPAAFSGLILGLGALLAFSGPPFNLGSTIWILGLAYLIIAMPLATVILDASISQIGHELTEASAISGASAGRTFARVQFPLLLPGLLAAWALVFVRIIGDVEAAAILSGTRNNVIGFRILEVFTYGSYAKMAGLGAFITIVTLLVLAAVSLLAKRLSRWSHPQGKSVLIGRGVAQ